MTTTAKNGTVLLVMDIQKRIVEHLADPKPLLDTIERAITGARGAGIPVIYVAVSFRPDYPEVSPSNQLFNRIKQGGNMFTTDDEGVAIHPQVAPQAGEVTVSKKRISAFAGSDLEIILRSMKAEHLVLSGLSTSGVVLSTLKEASDKDYQLTVLSDCCADPEQDKHEFLMTRIFAHAATVTTSAEWLDTIK